MSGQVTNWKIEVLDLPHLGEIQILRFELGGPIEPAQLREVVLPGITPHKGVILSGRGPVWLFAALAHRLHVCPWVATFDPRVGGGVVVQSHYPSIREGDVISLPEEVLKELTHF